MAKEILIYVRLLDTCHFSVDLLAMYAGVLWLTAWEDADFFVMLAEYCSLILCRAWAGDTVVVNDVRSELILYALFRSLAP